LSFSFQLLVDSSYSLLHVNSSCFALGFEFCPTWRYPLRFVGARTRSNSHLRFFVCVSALTHFLHNGCVAILSSFSLEHASDFECLWVLWFPLGTTCEMREIFIYFDRGISKVVIIDFLSALNMKCGDSMIYLGVPSLLGHLSVVGWFLGLTRLRAS